MTDSVIALKEIAVVNIKIGGKPNKLVLTENAVRLRYRNGVFCEKNLHIPLSAVDSIFFGWKRASVLLFIGIGVLMVGLVILSGERTDLSWWLFALGTLFLVAFWLYRPCLLLVYSRRLELGGVVDSVPEIEKFIDVLVSTLKSNRSGLSDFNA